MRAALAIFFLAISWRDVRAMDLTIKQGIGIHDIDWMKVENILFHGLAMSIPSKTPEISPPKTFPLKPSTKTPSETFIKNPTELPTLTPSQIISKEPSKVESKFPTIVQKSPMKLLTVPPTQNPTKFLTKTPTVSQTKAPSAIPIGSSTDSPTEIPSEILTKNPSNQPIQNTFKTLSKIPTQELSQVLSESPTSDPSESQMKHLTTPPTPNHNKSLTRAPTSSIKNIPSRLPIKAPFQLWTKIPSETSIKIPSQITTKEPSKIKSTFPTLDQSKSPMKKTPMLSQTKAPFKSPRSTQIPSYGSPTLTPTGSPTKMCHNISNWETTLDGIFITCDKINSLATRNKYCDVKVRSIAGGHGPKRSIKRFCPEPCLFECEEIGGSPSQPLTPAPTPFICPQLQTRGSDEYVEKVKGLYEKVSGTNAFDGNDIDRTDALNFILQERFCADPPRMIQRFISALFYFSTKGKNWVEKKSWLSNKHECSWNGLVCNVDLTITGINRDDNTLAGTLPFEVCDLSLLNRIDLDNNRIGGTLPTEIGGCKNLRVFDMDNNKLTGSFPDGIFSLSKLISVDMDSNQLTGTISTNFESLVDLRYLALHRNKFRGTIPASIGSLNKLEFAYFDQNDFTGSVPQSICANKGDNNFQKLNEVTADCKEPNPKVLCENNCCNNCFDSSALIYTIVISISGIDAVTTPGTPQNLATDWLVKDIKKSGELDFGLCGLRQRYIASVLYFSLGGNQWTNRLNFLSLGSECNWSARHNQIKRGLECSTINDTRCIDKILLDKNNLTGELPQEITELPYLTILDMDNNSISGTLPRNIGYKLPLLKEIDLDINNLSGKIPKSLFKLKNLLVLDIDTNNLTGDIIGLEQVKTLKHISVYENNLSGPIPDGLEKLTHLEILYLDQNNFTGAINQAVCANIDLNGGNISEIITDCDISCDCCFYCTRV
eukprot:CAMPEP_0194303406 /NCGR_PEP_ID=MMETSP0171-20130528/1275_1 /TAXON_ID=218684 /ORGANISM="Corethron pennatum, Strain L29A3" /LENGTH=941 /DNA_ID=CAMNT_0039054301 /DNA_START=46 /DNA_END=2871 /DNA_ORIENTATION=-